MHTLFTHIINILFPRSCGGCGKNKTLLCEKCIVNISKANQPAQSFITAIFDYRNQALRGVIWKFKYKNARSVAKYFGERLWEEIIGELGNDLHISKEETFLLVPIPLHRKRLRERGYNQSELLAREITMHDTSKIFDLAPDALVRTRETKAQAKSEKRTSRFENLKGAFIADPALVRKKNIILIDDVTTTGATLAEARKVLLKAGAKTVRAYTIAH
ncbi:MAG: ComF family protein [Candidatus Yonathbacteria bacterium]|nr:ComF family protein [Candidatus Yonathbacteria bacterium]